MQQSEAQVLQRLEDAIASLPPASARKERHREEPVSLSKRARPTNPEKRAAIEAEAKLYGPLRDLVAELGQARYEPAVPTLARIWCESAYYPLRVDAGHALSR